MEISANRNIPKLCRQNLFDITYINLLGKLHWYKDIQSCIFCYVQAKSPRSSPVKQTSIHKDPIDTEGIVLVLEEDEEDEDDGGEEVDPKLHREKIILEKQLASIRQNR